MKPTVYKIASACFAISSSIAIGFGVYYGTKKIELEESKLPEGMSLSRKDKAKIMVPRLLPGTLLLGASICSYLKFDRMQNTIINGLNSSLTATNAILAANDISARGIVGPKKAEMIKKDAINNSRTINNYIQSNEDGKFLCGIYWPDISDVELNNSLHMSNADEIKRCQLDLDKDFLNRVASNPANDAWMRASQIFQYQGVEGGEYLDSIGYSYSKTKGLPDYKVDVLNIKDKPVLVLYFKNSPERM